MKESKIHKKKLVIIGASTGGPAHIDKILSSLLSGFNASIVIAQHMSHEYIPSFAKSLNSKSNFDVYSIKNHTNIKPASIYICSRLTTIKIEKNDIILSSHENKHYIYTPSIDLLFESASLIADKIDILGVVLTGIGDDGAKGSLELSKAGGLCVAESQESAIVYGMPMRVKKLNDKVKMQCLDEIIDTINKFGSSNV